MLKTQDIQHAPHPVEKNKIIKTKTDKPVNKAQAPGESSGAAVLHAPVEVHPDFFDAPKPSEASMDNPGPAGTGAALASPKGNIEQLSTHLRHLNKTYTYDRFVNVQALADAIDTYPDASLETLQQKYLADSPTWMKSHGGGNCVGLCGELVKRLKEDNWTPCLVSSTLKNLYTIAGAPAIGHVAVMVSVDVGLARPRQLLLEPGFNFAKPIEIPHPDEGEKRTSYDGGYWVMTRNYPQTRETDKKFKDVTSQDKLPPQGGDDQVFCYQIPSENVDQTDGSVKDFKGPAVQEVATYYLNAKESAEDITRGIAGLDQRPIILKRNEAGDIVGQITFDVQGKKVGLKAGSLRGSFPIEALKSHKIDELPKTNKGQQVSLEALATAFEERDPGALAQKIHAQARAQERLQLLRPAPKASKQTKKAKQTKAPKQTKEPKQIKELKQSKEPGAPIAPKQNQDGKQNQAPK